MNDARSIVEAMHGDLDRFNRDLGRRSARLATEHLAELRADFFRARLSPWSAASKIAAMAMVGEAVQQMQAKQSGVLGRALPTVARASRDRQAAFLQLLDERFGGAVRPLRFDTLAWLETHSRSQIRLRQFPRSFARYGAAAVQDVEDALTKLSITGQPWHRARAQVWAATHGVVMGRQWMVDRILRTETSAIYNGTALAAMEAEDTPESPMFKRLIATFDGRTGWDSVAVHGQIRPIREPFRDPAGRLYQAPPNRPHDREVLVPHRAAWGERLVYLGGPHSSEAAEETSTPPALPPHPTKTSVRIGSGVPAAAAAAVIALSGQVGEARRVRAPGEARKDGDLETLLLHQLEEARVRLAAARLADAATGGDGLPAGSLRTGEVLSAAGMMIRVARITATKSGLLVTLSIGGETITGEYTKRLRLPFRRAEPTLTPSSRVEREAAEAVASAIRTAITKHGGDEILLASR